MQIRLLWIPIMRYEDLYHTFDGFLIVCHFKIKKFQSIKIKFLLLKIHHMEIRQNFKFSLKLESFMIDFKTSFQKSPDEIYTCDSHAISGFVKMMGSVYSFATDRLYERLTRRLIKHTTADKNGYYF